MSAIKVWHKRVTGPCNHSSLDTSGHHEELLEVEQPWFIFRRQLDMKIYWTRRKFKMLLSVWHLTLNHYPKLLMLYMQSFECYHTCICKQAVSEACGHKKAMFYFIWYQWTHGIICCLQSTTWTHFLEVHEEQTGRREGLGSHREALLLDVPDQKKALGAIGCNKEALLKNMWRILFFHR